ncbi:MAG: S-methyl-5-thioribose-1-phosphate isomerase [Gammaproteobacteria bacterium]|nr:S-methyl-5-thioribose-1-phosphate isomerase [Gammaproteobacteria bacterium]
MTPRSPAFFFAGDDALKVTVQPPDDIPYDRIRAVEWADDCLKLIDQRLLPGRLEILSLTSVAAAAQAITDMVVRGAPAIGITAAYAVVLAARARFRADPANWPVAIEADLELLAAARPTAVNLRWAVARMRGLIRAGIAGESADATDPMARRTSGASRASITSRGPRLGPIGDPAARLLDEARRIHAEDIAANHRMGALGAALIEPGSDVLTHCNTGALATGGYGTALGVVRAGVAAGRIARVYADETRPWLQGARLTAWELLQEGIPVTLIADGACAHLLKQGAVRWVIVGADRIAANGDTANKIGTYMTALAARYHGVKFMVVAPTSTVDLATADGAAIPIENRSADEVLQFAGARTAPVGAHAWNPAFDVTPAALIDAIVTEKGVVLAPTAEKIRAMMAPS